MKKTWKIYIRDKENLRTLLNLLLANRETEVTIRKNSGLILFVNDDGRENEIVQYAKEELGNRVERASVDPRWKENVFLFSRPRNYFDSAFSFLIETSSLLINGDSIHLRVERYRTMNPFKRKILGSKATRILYRIRLFTPILMRDYSNRDGKQSLTFERRNPLLFTGRELSCLINGGEVDGLLAV